MLDKRSEIAGLSRVRHADGLVKNAQREATGSDRCPARRRQVRSFGSTISMPIVIWRPKVFCRVTTSRSLPLIRFRSRQSRQEAAFVFAACYAFSPSRSLGPRSLIYHEGRAFRVVRAKLPASWSWRQAAMAATLADQGPIVVCSNPAVLAMSRTEPRTLSCLQCDRRVAGELGRSSGHFGSTMLRPRPAERHYRQ